MTEVDSSQFPDNKKEIFCNKCTVSCRGHAGNLNGLIEIKVSGAYDSSHFEDGAIYQFSLCERCLLELFSTFKLTSHYKGNFIFPEDDDLALPNEEERQRILNEFFTKKESERLK